MSCNDTPLSRATLIVCSSQIEPGWYVPTPQPLGSSI